MLRSLVGSEMCIRDRTHPNPLLQQQYPTNDDNTLHLTHTYICATHIKKHTHTHTHIPLLSHYHFPIVSVLQHTFSFIVIRRLCSLQIIKRRAPILPTGVLIRVCI
eukprot:TRINITY_DN9035_c0_g2_i3.p1 TRINITY_DN9035_c0_g2~~TRINITY_DN9035_c0_g2_i3.p1  ORF type:complete len:121 (-),score=22.06 TRINITY_DN9035_c0_g2_i3:10-327(-)